MSTLESVYLMLILYIASAHRNMIADVGQHITTAAKIHLAECTTHPSGFCYRVLGVNPALTYYLKIYTFALSLNKKIYNHLPLLIYIFFNI